MKIGLIAGRDFDLAAHPTDSSGVIVNETAVALMGYKDPIGKPIYSGKFRAHIIGVVHDFHFQSLHGKIMPLVLEPGRNDRYSHILIRTQAGQAQTAIEAPQQLCKRLNPAFPFTYHRWLAAFAYRTDIPWWVFAVTGSAVALMALFTVCWQTLRAATANPVKSLRSE